MKIAYINYIPYDNVVGVEKKISHQAKVAKKLNIPIDFIILNSFMSKKYENLNFIKIEEKKLVKKLYRYSIIEKYVNIDSYDYIVLRYTNVDFSSISFIKSYRNKIITEHHTDEIKELEVSVKNFIGKFRLWLEKRYSPIFLSKVKGIIAVTEEIAKIELKKANKKIPFAVVSNGIDVESVPFTKFKKFDGKNLNIIFVASKFAPWHGIDILFKSFENYTKDVNIRLFIIGDLEDSLKKEALSYESKKINIKILGKKFGKELDFYFENSNIAISSLAIYRNGLNQACVLKTREYIARGIPFVYGYDDVDLEGNENFALKIEKKINIDNIIDFVKNVSIKDNISEKMRKFANDKLDWSIKIGNIYNYIKNLNKDINNENDSIKAYNEVC